MFGALAGIKSAIAPFTGLISSGLNALKDTPLKYLDPLGVWSGKNIVQRIQESKFGRQRGLDKNATLGRLGGFVNSMGGLGRQVAKEGLGVELPEQPTTQDEVTEAHPTTMRQGGTGYNPEMTPPRPARSAEEIAKRRADIRKLALRQVN